MKNEEFVNELVGELKPYKVLGASPLLVLVCALVAVIITYTASTFVAPLRAGVFSQFVDSLRFSAEFATGILVVFFACWSALSLSIPSQPKKIVFVFLGLAITSFVSLFAYSYFITPAVEVSMLGKRPSCFYEGLGYGVVLYLGFILLVRQRAAFLRSTVGLCSGLGACSLTAMLMHVGCMYEPHHILTHHLYPVLLLGGLGALFAPLLLKKF